MDSQAASSTSPRPSRRSTALAAGPIATGTQHVCFICLLNDTETPDTSWVNPCPCTLEAHEECMLRWVAETEQSSSRPKHGLRCPACNARIRVDEPFDSVVYVRDRMHRAYSRTSPLILLTFVLTGGIAGSGWYGLTATHIFAGPDATARWLDLQSLVRRQPSVPLWRWMPFWKLNAKIWVLSLIAPALTFCRALQPLGNLVMIPSAILSAVFLVSRDEMPTWPPSPAWAMTLFPFLQFTYSNVYYEFFGAFDKRLNRALRGRPIEEEPQPPRQNGQAQAAGQGDEPDEGLWATLMGLGHAVVGLFGEEHEVVLEAEVHVGGGNHELDEDAELDEVDEAEVEAELAELQRAVLARALEMDGEDGDREELDGEDEDRQAVEHNAVDPAEETGPPAQPEQNQLQDQPQDQPQPEGQVEAQDEAQNLAQNNQGQAPPPAEDNRANTTLTDIVNNIVTSLLYPTICFGMGELLHATLPRRWVTRPAWGRPTGLLQERWGRSLAGGCLYVVLKDAFVLYAKYRRVQVKQNRKVRNVEKRR